MVRAVAASAQKPVEEEEEVTVATMMVYVLALAWLISYASFLWVESLPTELPCAWGIHGCAPHALCQAGWPPSLFSLPSCEQLPPRTLPRNHPPVPAGAGLCSAALASLGAARCRKPRPANGSARVAPRRLRPCQSTPRAAPSSRRPRPLRCSCYAGPCCVGDGVQRHVRTPSYSNHAAALEDPLRNRAAAATARVGCRPVPHGSSNDPLEQPRG